MNNSYYKNKNKYVKNKKKYIQKGQGLMNITSNPSTSTYIGQTNINIPEPKQYDSIQFNKTDPIDISIYDSLNDNNF